MPVSERDLGRVTYSVLIPKVANSTVERAVIPECDVRIETIKVLQRGTVTTSAAGIYTLAVKVGATTVLVAATVDLNGTCTTEVVKVLDLAAGTVSEMNPDHTAPAAILDVDAGTPILIDAVSNNNDLLGGDYQVFVVCQKR